MKNKGGLKKARLAILAALFIWSTLAFWSAEQLWAFKLSLAATEFGCWLAPLALLLAFAGRGRFSRSLGTLAAVLFFSSVPRAWFLARQEKLPFSFQELYTGLYDSKAAPPKEYEYDPARQLRMTFWAAESPDPAPCVIVIHGGGWDDGQRGGYPQLNAFLANRSWNVADIDYRLAPGSRWPAQRDDILAARDWLKANAAILNIDPARFALLGRSAGAHLALATAYLQPQGFKAVVSLYGPADLRFAWKYGDPHDILNSLKLLRNFMGGSPDQASAAYDDASPYFHVGKDTPPTLLIHGEKDRLVWHKQSERLDAKLSEAGRPHRFISLPWAVHAFDYNASGPGGQIEAEAVDQFLNQYLNSASAQ